MAKSAKKIILPLFFVVGLMLVYMIQVPYKVEIQTMEQGEPAPDFLLSDLQGKEVRLSELRGNLVFLNFWATWCPPCRDEMPSMEALYRKLQGRAFQMLAVSIDDSKNQVERFQNSFQYTFPMLFDDGQKVAALYRTTGVPETFIISPDGIIVSKIIGPYDWNTAETLEYIEKILPQS